MVFQLLQSETFDVYTLILIPKDDRFNRDAEELNRNLNAYAHSHAKVILLDTALKIKDFIHSNEQLARHLPCRCNALGQNQRSVFDVRLA